MKPDGNNTSTPHFTNGVIFKSTSRSQLYEPWKCLSIWFHRSPYSVPIYVCSSANVPRKPSQICICTRIAVFLCNSRNYRSNISNTRDSVSSRRESWTYDARRNNFDEIRIWIADETLSRVFNIPSQSKQKLRSKRRSKLVKIYDN